MRERAQSTQDTHIVGRTSATQFRKNIYRKQLVLSVYETEHTIPIQLSRMALNKVVSVIFMAVKLRILRKVLPLFANAERKKCDRKSEREKSHRVRL